MSQADSWKVCSICRAPILHEAQYFLCSVSTCRSKRTGLFFCSLPCFEAHLPTLRHRDAWAEQERAPTRAQAAAEAAKATAEPAASTTDAARMTEDAPRRRIVGAAPEPAEEEAKDVLVVVSKLKKFVRDRSGMNTSDSAVSVLSDHLRWLSIEALRQAAADGRKTVMDRDFDAVLKALKRPQT